MLLDVYERHDVASVVLRAPRGSVATPPADRPIADAVGGPPRVSVAGDTRSRIESVLADVTAPRGGLITLERARMLTVRSCPTTLPEELHEATKLTIYVGRHDRVDGLPAHVAICDLLHRRGIAGATVLLGVDGTAHGERERAQLLRPQRRRADR